MPQMDILTFSSQNFWFLVTFTLAFGLLNGSILNTTHKSLAFIKKVSNNTQAQTKPAFTKKTLAWNFLK